MKAIFRASSLLLVLALAVAAFPTANAFAADDLVGPVTSNVVLAPNPATVGATVTVTATVDDTTTGGSNIQGAQFSVNGGTWTDMTAVDGAFDSATEDVTGSFTMAAGDNQVCVQGTDVVPNTGTAVCVDLGTQSLYTFNGFFPPIRMTGMKVKAGRNIPVKFSLFLAADGTPISDRSVIVGVQSYSVDCTTLQGDPTTAVTEKGPGKGKGKGLGVMGIIYRGAGKWLAHWKTPKIYKNTCRMMYVAFSDGSQSPAVLFTFR